MWIWKDSHGMVLASPSMIQTCRHIRFQSLSTDNLPDCKTQTASMSVSDSQSLSSLPLSQLENIILLLNKVPFSYKHSIKLSPIYFPQEHMLSFVWNWLLGWKHMICNFIQPLNFSDDFFSHFCSTSALSTMY